MRKIGSTGRSLLVSGLVVLSLSAGSAAAQDLNAYTDSLQNGFASWGWATTLNWADTTQHHTGTASISFAPSNWEAAFLHRDAGIDTYSYDTLTVWVRGSAANENVRVALTSGGSVVGTDAALGSFIAGGAIPNGTWAQATIPFSSLGVTSGIFDGFWFQAGVAGAQATIYLDDIVVKARTTPPPPPPVVNVGVNPGGTRTPINPLIYGVAHFNGAGDSQLAYPARRWGGNAVTRYNWEIDVQNHASDWFFINEPNSVANPSLLPNDSTADLWVDSVKAHQGEPVLTVPTIGWAPKGSNPLTDRLQLYGYSVAKYGAQQQTEYTASGGAAWANPDAGNGCTPSSPAGTCTWLSVTPDPADTSKAVGPAYFTAWLNHIAARVGSAASGGVKYLILDNEPMLWNSTHHDVHPTPVTYDELWGKDLAGATAWKANDPNVEILGGAAWGWCEYFNSSKDSALYGACGPGAVGNAASDYVTHGSIHWLPYLLQQAEAYRVAHGTRIMDFLDIHYYPQSGGVFSSDESAGTAALRLRCLKSLYDPTYSDESWIGQPINLIPRMKAWIAQYAPGTKLAINEYNFGDGTTSSALAQAEALAIFGREGVDMANRWVVPPANTLLEDAFLLYLNYDGAGAKVAGDSIPTTSSDVNGVGAYSVRGPSNVYLLLFNKDTQSRQANVTITGGPTATANLWRFSSARLASAGTAAVTAGALTLTLPTRSATLVVVPFGSCTPDQTPPTVTPPAGIVIDQSICCGSSGGATPGSSAALATFVAGGSATDNCAGTPARLTAQVGGVDVTATTCFPAGTTPVTFRFQDAAANVGTATANVTVRMFGDLNSDGLVDSSDMVVLRSYLNLAATQGTPPFTAPLSIADVNHDTAVDASDLVYLRSYFSLAVACLAP